MMASLTAESGLELVEGLEEEEEEEVVVVVVVVVVLMVGPCAVAMSLVRLGVRAARVAVRKVESMAASL